VSRRPTANGSVLSGEDVNFQQRWSYTVRRIYEWEPSEVTMFDPVTGKVIDPDALRSLQFNGQGMRVPSVRIEDGKKVTEIVHEGDGGTAGQYIEHPSGRIDANVQARAAHVGAESE
jgi:hypothetical protein